MAIRSVLDTIDERRSVRSFNHKTVGVSMVDRIIESCDKAPSAGGLQSFEIYLTKDVSLKKLLTEAAFSQSSITEAPIVLIFCTNASRSSSKYGERSNLYSIQDATIASCYAQLTAQALGLASVWIGAFDEARVAKTLAIPGSQRPVAILPIGYPNETPEERVTRGPNDLVHMVGISYRHPGIGQAKNP